MKLVVSIYRQYNQWPCFYSHVLGVDNQNIIESYKNAFFGYQCFEWIMEYTSVVSNDESESIAAEFVLYGWIQQVLDKSDKSQSKKDETAVFKTGRKTQYYLTDKGRFVLDTDSNTVTHTPIPGGTLSLAAARSRAHSSTSSSNSSIMTNNSNKLLSPLKNNSKKEDHSSRLLPTTAESLLANDESGSVIIPKAIITKQKITTKTNDSAVVVEDEESALQIDNSSCDFGFSSASSTTSSTATTVEVSSSISKSTFNNRKAVINVTDIPIDEQMNKLKVSAAPTHNTTDQPSSQNSRLQNILNDPLIRLYFRRYLKSSFCEENVNFWVDYTALVKKIGVTAEEEYNEDIEAKLKKRIEQLPTEFCESLLTHCSTIYNTYFCPQNASSELNIDHGLRHDIIQYMQATFVPCLKSNKNDPIDLSSAARVDAPFGSISVSSHGILTSSVARNNDGVLGTTSVMREGLQESPQLCLYKIIYLYDLANEHVCKIMAQDSVPRFIRTDKYRDLMQSYYQHPQTVSDHDN